MGRRVGLLAGLLYAVVPFNVFYDRLALAEALLNAEAIWVFTLSVFILSKARGDRSAVLAGIGLGTVLGMALWTKMLALFILPFPLICIILLSRRQKIRTLFIGFTVASVIAIGSATLLFLSPEAGHLWNKTRSFAESPNEFLVNLPDRLSSNALAYWRWFQSYLPMPLWVFVILAVLWGIIRRTRLTLLFVGCWAVFTVSTMLWSKPVPYSTRYVLEGLFPLLLLLASLIDAVWDALNKQERFSRRSLLARGLLSNMAAGLLFILLIGPALWFDVQLINSPESTPLPPEDRMCYITSYCSGYGFNDAVGLLKQRAIELTANGQPVIVLSNYYWGDVYGGLKMYLRGIPNVVFYVDSHMTWNPEDFIATWKPHRVPILLLGNDGIDRLDEFERVVPQAKRLGFFPKPTGQSSFRVYEVGIADLDS
jgi:hypothetical protein